VRATSAFRLPIGRWVAAPAAAALLAVVLLISNVSAAPTVTTDKADYLFFETVTITGGGFNPPNSSYDVPVIRPDGTIVKGDGSTITPPEWDTVLASGTNFTYLYQLGALPGLYEVRVYASPWSGNLAESPLASVTFTDAPPQISLEQCRNGTAASPEDCIANMGNGWGTGNVGDQQGHLVEGYSIPYRAIMENLPTSTSITVTLGYDIKHSGAHAIDYLTHYDRLEPHFATFGHAAETVTPTDGVSGISAPTTTFAIPAPSSTSSCASPVSGQPTTSFNSLPAGERVMTLFGGTITAIAYTTTPPQGCLTDAQAETQIEVTFTVASSTAVLSWGGHIAKALDWSPEDTAGGISGSPYHMRFIDWSLTNIGNQDRSLSAGTVEAKGTIIVDKVTVPSSDPQSFTFTPSYGSPFNLTDAATPNDSGLLDPNTYSVSETVPAGWTLTSTTCDDGSPVNAIVLDAGETVTCTFTNTKLPTLTIVKTVINDDGGTKVVSDFPLFIDGSPVTSGVANTVSVGSHTASETTQAGYAASSWSGDCNPDGTITLTPGQNATCTITNDDVGPTLKLVKTVVNDDGGTKVVSDFPLFIDGSPVTSGVANPATVGSHTASETTQAGYAASSWSGDCNPDGTITLTPGQNATCTITNDDIPIPLPPQPTLKVVKNVVPDDPTTNWNIVVTGPTPFSDTLSGDDMTAQTPADAGGYVITETAGANTDLADYNTSFSCTGATPSVSGSGTVINVTVDPGENVVCTFTNKIVGVGGIVEFGGVSGGSELSPATESSAGSASGQGYGLLAAGIAAALLLASGVWYARRRLLG